MALVSGRGSVAEASRVHGVAESGLHRWQREFLENTHAPFASGCSEQEARIRELEGLAGQPALELEVLNKASALTGFPAGFERR